MQIDKSWFMLKKLLWDLSNKGKYVTISDDLSSPRLGPYYIAFGTDLSKLNKLIVGYDEEGIPLNKSYIDVESTTTHYYPISIGQVAMAIYNAYQQSNEASKRAHFIRIADWFIKTRVDDPRLGTFWYTDVPKPEYQVTDRWKSAFTQSRAISVLMRAWQLEKKEIYLDTATLALQPFTIDIAKGGVSIRRQHTGVFYEEYVASAPTRVLDGHLFALFGLFDYVRAAPSPTMQKYARQLFDQGVQGLVDDLPHYDLGNWVRFNRCELPNYPTDDPCTITYLQLIIIQLEIIYRITARQEVENYRRKFESYITWKNILAMYQSKLKSLRNLKRL